MPISDKKGVSMHTVIRHSSELLAYLCGVLFCVGMAVLVLGQLQVEGLGALGFLSLSLLLAADAMLAWVAVGGLIKLLKDGGREQDLR